MRLPKILRPGPTCAISPKRPERVWKGAAGNRKAGVIAPHTRKSLDRRVLTFHTRTGTVPVRCHTLPNAAIVYMYTLPYAGPDVAYAGQMLYVHWADAIRTLGRRYTYAGQTHFDASHSYTVLYPCAHVRKLILVAPKVLGSPKLSSRLKITLRKVPQWVEYGV